MLKIHGLIKTSRDVLILISGKFILSKLSMKIIRNAELLKLDFMRSLVCIRHNESHWKHFALTIRFIKSTVWCNTVNTDKLFEFVSIWKQLFTSSKNKLKVIHCLIIWIYENDRIRAN